MLDQLSQLRDQAVSSLAQVNDPKELEAWRIAYLGRKGSLTQVLRGLGALTPDERRSVGAEANQLKSHLEAVLAEKEAALTEGSIGKLAAQEGIDVTLPGRPVLRGHLHPITQVVGEITTAFRSMGFAVTEGPEIEWEYYNFDALNIPGDHPARDMQDTFWMDWQTPDGKRPMLMRTHTSPMQIRYMESHKPPARVVVPGKVYRNEATDATHEWHFHQVEGLVVDEGVSFADLKGTLFEFARRLFGVERKVRFRCDYFPFVEPGAEMAVDCFLCDGKGCRVCSQTGWLEIMGAGMVHPKILERLGIDSERYTGYAFGMGVERITMLKYGIDDIRLFYANDLRFLKQF